MLKFDLESSAELPFEQNYYIRAEETVCWFVQREKMREIEEKGLPDYLRLEEEKCCFSGETFPVKTAAGCELQQFRYSV